MPLFAQFILYKILYDEHKVALLQHPKHTIDFLAFFLSEIAGNFLQLAQLSSETKI